MDRKMLISVLFVLIALIVGGVVGFYASSQMKAPEVTLEADEPEMTAVEVCEYVEEVIEERRPHISEVMALGATYVGYGKWKVDVLLDFGEFAERDCCIFNEDTALVSELDRYR